MSHFSTWVAIPAAMIQGRKVTHSFIENLLDIILEPYNESTGNPIYQRFEDCTEKCKTGYESDKIDAVVRVLDGKKFSIYNTEFSHQFDVIDNIIYEKRKHYSDAPVQSIASKCFEFMPQVPVKEIYSFEDYCGDYCGYEQNEDGEWGYFCNPKATWDWFTLGGRFGGAFLAKQYLPNTLYTNGTEPQSQNCGEYQLVDGTIKKNIAWDEMYQTQVLSATEHFRALEQAFLTKNISQISQFSLCSLQDDGIYGWGDLLYKAGETLEEYLHRQGLNMPSSGGHYPYSFVDLNGTWHSKGDMGWFGLSSNDKPEDTWHSEVGAFVDGLNAADFIVVVDCHL